MKPSALRKLHSGSLRILPFQEIQRKVECGEYQYHPFKDCFVITQVMTYENERVLEVVLLFGDDFLSNKEKVVSHLVKFGKEHGCKAVEAISRLGLEPTLKPLGFRRKKVLLRKEIE